MKDEHLQVIELWNIGYSVQRISKMTGYSRTYTRQLISEIRPYTIRRSDLKRWSDVEIAFIREYAQECGYDFNTSQKIKELRDEYFNKFKRDRSTQAVRIKLRELGLVGKKRLN